MTINPTPPDDQHVDSTDVESEPTTPTPPTPQPPSPIIRETPTRGDADTLSLQTLADRIDALPETLAKVWAEQHPTVETPVQKVDKPKPKASTPREEESPAKTPAKKTFAEIWFGR